MTETLAIYLSDMSESDKLVAIRRMFLPLATMLESLPCSTGSLVKEWNSEEIEIEAAFVNANWI